MTFSFDLSGQVAVVTGASRGIGREVCLALGRAGARVACVATTQESCAATVAAMAGEDLPAVAFGCDVSDSAAVDRLAEEVLSQFGRLDVLVNNAGVTRDGLLLRMSDADFDRVLGVNLRGTFLMTRAFGRFLLKARKGRIVNISSVVGLTGNAGQSNYAASKAGIIGFTKSVARELAGRGILVNAVAPGFVDTDMTSTLPAAVKEGALRNIPMGRFGTGADIAGAVLFLSSALSSYMTGQVLVVDGGMAM
jgi:3-oxoacyl-[acyl-carrier protein] reductase